MIYNATSLFGVLLCFVLFCYPQVKGEMMKATEEELKQEKADADEILASQ